MHVYVLHHIMYSHTHRMGVSCGPVGGGGGWVGTLGLGGVVGYGHVGQAGGVYGTCL